MRIVTLIALALVATGCGRSNLSPKAAKETAMTATPQHSPEALSLARVQPRQPGAVVEIVSDALGADGFHPLGLACFFGHVDSARELLEHGAEVDALSKNEHIQTAAIHAAAASGETAVDEATRYEVVELVLDHGADANLPQAGGFRAIDAARQNGDERLERLLKERGAAD